MIGVELPDGSYRMPMYVVTRPGVELTDALAERLRTSLRTLGSPRHVPTGSPPYRRCHTRGRAGSSKCRSSGSCRAPRRPMDVISIAAVTIPSLIDFYIDEARRWRA